MCHEMRGHFLEPPPGTRSNPGGLFGQITMLEAKTAPRQHFFLDAADAAAPGRAG